jgi:type IV secretory pathway VirB9-like protein
MTRYLFPLLVGTVLSSPAFALDQCKPSPQDPQTRICAYSSAQRYVVNGLLGFPVNLKFGNSERIERFEPSYTGTDKSGNPVQTWKGPSVNGGGKAGVPGLSTSQFQNNLPIWPFAEGHSSMLVMTTTADGKERPYLFDMNARKSADCGQDAKAPGCSGDTVTTAALIFTYPEDEAAAAVEKKKAALIAWKAQQDKAKEAEAAERLKTDVLYGPRNFSYQAKADSRFKELAPSEVSDNGWLTEFQWPANDQIPAITMLDPASGQERIAPTTTQGHMIVVNGTAEWFRLRLGKAVMDIHNLNWKADRADPGTGTTSPDVVRQVISRNGK